MTAHDPESLRRQVLWLERERALLAFELHDGVVQEITAAGMFLDGVERLWDSDPEKARERLAEARHLIRESVAEARRLMEGLRPASLEQGGLPAALSELASSAQRKAPRDLHVDLDIRLTADRLAPAVESAVYRLVQEALSNVIKHSGASRAHVEAFLEGQTLVVAIGDDGAGFDPAAADPNRFGLRGMRERAAALDGALAVESAPGRGTRIEARLPATPPASAQGL